MVKPWLNSGGFPEKMPRQNSFREPGSPQHRKAIKAAFRIQKFIGYCENGLLGEPLPFPQLQKKTSQRLDAVPVGITIRTEKGES